MIIFLVKCNIIVMANCAIPLCGVSRKRKYRGISIFKISKASCNSEWRSSLVEAIKRTREVDIFICERHFRTEDIEFTSRLLLYILFILNE